MAETFQNQISANRRNSFLLTLVVVILFALLGFSIGYAITGDVVGALVAMAIALAVGAMLGAGSFFSGDSLVLAASGAKEVNETSAPQLMNVVREMSLAANVPMPKVYVIDDTAPNAFATGRDPKHAAIAVTTGLLEKMNRVELEGVVAHEISHIRNYDILISTLAVTMVGAAALLADMGIRMMWWNGGRVSRSGDRDSRGNPLALIGFALLILAPIVARAMQAAISRNRETLADVSACQLTRYPPGLISALEKLQADTTVTHSASTATAHLWIEQPMSGVGDNGRLGGLHRMFDTHPPLEERIALLREL